MTLARGLIVGTLALVIIAGGAASGAPKRPRLAPSASYIQALHVADLFLTAWAKKDVEAGMALMSQRLLGGTSGGPLDEYGGPREYMSGMSNPHHEAFEIRSGKRSGPHRYAFPVKVFELYLGERSGFVYSDTLEVVRQVDVWRVDRVPRNRDPD